MDKIQEYIGDPPEPTCFIDDVIEIDYFVKALKTRLKYCPGQNVGILLSAESARRIVKALKEQEHGETFTVIDTKTGKEADEYEIALHEDWAKHLCYCDMDGWAIMDDGSLLLVDECGRFAYADRERFKVVWDA